ncbi:MAG TPA: hypothetical protein VMS17_14740 [Gemmataceae bacterium]|nr:hypothetical protein [Gemmataceae bacterium]
MSPSFLGPPTELDATPYQVFTGKGTLFEGPEGRSLAGQDLLSGPNANTILVVEAEQRVPWTKPEDLPYDPDKPLPKLGAPDEGGFFAVCADSSVHFFEKDADVKELRRLILWKTAEK